MSEPTSFTQEAIRDFMIFRGGKVTNHELVKHFKKFLTNPGSQEEARVLFKEYVNNLATITRDPDGGKQLVLKKRYRTPSTDQSFNTSGLPPTPLSPIETPTLNLRYQPVYQSSFELDLGSPHRSPYRRLSSESLSSSYSLRSPGTPTSSYPLGSPVFPPAGSSVGYQQIVTPLGYAAPSYHNPSIPTSPQHLVASEPPIGIPTGPVQPLGIPSQPPRMIPLTPTPLGMQNPSPSLPSIPTSLAVSSSSSGIPLGLPQSSSVSNISSSTLNNQQYKSNPSSPMTSQNFRHSSPRRQSSNDSVFADSPLPPKEHDPPPVPPRRRSSDKSLTKMDLKDLEDFKPREPPGTPMSVQSGASTPTPTATPVDQKTDDNKENLVEDSKISVKERMQKFDRMASESALLSKNTSSLNTNLFKKRQEKLDRDEEDTGSVTLIDAKTRDWLVKCAQADYQGIVKMAAENPKLVKFKDPNTALHWAAKHGNEDLVKLIAGTHAANVNAKTGYTPLHIAMQYGHDECYNLLVEVYGADHTIRDYSGKKPRQYLTNKGTSVSVDTFRKCQLFFNSRIPPYNFIRLVSYVELLLRRNAWIELSLTWTIRKQYFGSVRGLRSTPHYLPVDFIYITEIKAMKKHAAEKDLGFLRIGSLNVRVKRTTEAFSNFLGVGNPDKLHKHWGSADNLHQGDNKRMPPPKFAPIKKRKSKRGQQDFGTPIRAQSLIEKRAEHSNQDSDSDTAAGFGTSWQSTV